MLPLLTKYSPASRNFILSFVGTNKARDFTFTLPLAKLLVGCMPTPTTAPETVDTALERGDMDQFSEVLMELNELFKVDLDGVRLYAGKLYALRCHQLFSYERSIPLSASDTAVPDFFGISLFLSLDDIRNIVLGYKEIALAEAGLRNILQDLKSNNG